MSRHFPELHKIIMTAIEKEDYRLKCNIDRDSWSQGIGITMEIPKTIRPIRMFMTSAFTETSTFENGRLWVLFPKTWFLGADTFFDENKLFNQTEKGMVKSIFEAEFNRQKVVEALRVMDRNRGKDSRVSEIINWDLENR